MNKQREKEGTERDIKETEEEQTKLHDRQRNDHQWSEETETQPIEETR